MPLVKSATKAARQENIRREIAAGKSPRQAVAIGYFVQREAKPGVYKASRGARKAMSKS